MNYIQGSFYVGTDILVQLDTTIQLAGNSGLNLLVLFPNGTTQTYEGTIVNYTICEATIPAGDNTQYGALQLQSQVTLGGITSLGLTCQLTVLQAFAP